MVLPLSLAMRAFSLRNARLSLEAYLGGVRDRQDVRYVWLTFIARDPVYESWLTYCCLTGLVNDGTVEDLDVMRDRCGRIIYFS